MSRKISLVLGFACLAHCSLTMAQPGTVLPDLLANYGFIDVTDVNNDGVSNATAFAGGMSPPAEPPAAVLDNDVNSKWLAFEPGGTFFDIDLIDGPATVKSYSITSANDFAERDPFDWILYGSNNGVNFTEIDFRLDVIFESRFETQVFEIPNPGSYQFYEFDFFTQFGSLGFDPRGEPNSIQIAEIELLEDFSLSDLATLTIDRDTGGVDLSNPSPFDFNIMGITIESTAGGLNTSEWIPVTGNYDGGGNGALDSGTWNIDSQTAFELAESTAGTTGLLQIGQNLDLGLAWLQNPVEDVEATILLTDGSTLPIFVEYVGNNGNSFEPGDLNGDGVIDAADWTQCKAGQGFDFSTASPVEGYLQCDLNQDQVHDLVDIRLFRTLFDNFNGAGAFDRMLEEIPEPTGVSLVAAGLLGMLFVRRKLPKALWGLLLVVVIGLPATPTIAGELLGGPLGSDLTDPDNDGILDVSVTAGDELNSPLGEGPLSALDNDTATKWLAFQPNGTFYQMTFNNGAQHAVNSYTVSSANDFAERNPYAWTLSGSNDGVNYTVVDSQNTQLFTDFFQTQRFRTGNSVPYSSYRFEFETALGAGAFNPGNPNSLQLSELELFADPTLPILTLRVDGDTGGTLLMNNSSSAISLNGYEITSPSGALDVAGWDTIQSQGIAGFPPGNGSGNGWEPGPGSNANELAEWYLTGESTLGAGQEIDLGGAFDFGGVRDLGFTYQSQTLGEVHGYIEYLNAEPNSCDFDNSGVCDLDDIDALVTTIAAGSNDAAFDLTGDGLVDLADRDEWLALAGAENLPSGNPYLLGDANLDGFVDVPDFNLWNGNKFTMAALWSKADFNADGFVDVPDFNIWNGNKFQAADGVSAVPEPTCGLMLLSGLCLLLGARR